jgi:CRISPR/Cas system-associated endonuclease Cas1
LIEEFRTFVVDRSVFSMINREEPIETEPKSGKLTRESRRLVAQNVVERLGSYTRYRKESHRLSRVIEEQAYRLARHLEGGKKYKGFVGRY